MKSWSSRRLALVLTIVLAGSLTLGLPAAANLWLYGGDTAQVLYTGGEGVSVRAQPGYDAEVLATLPEGYLLTIVDGPVWAGDGSAWYIVSTDAGVTGWVASTHLDLYASAYANDIPDDADAAASAAPLPVHTGGPDLNLRLGPSSGDAVVAAVPDGAWVEILAPGVRDGNGTSWSLVRYAGNVGYVASAYIGDSAFVGMSSTTVEPVYQHQAIVSDTGGDGVNVRADATINSGIRTALWDDTVVELLDGPFINSEDEAWYHVAFEDVVGWIDATYLTPLDAGTARSLATGADATGAAIVAEALNYLGVPYLWAGTTPVGFDCSGYTWYVLNRVLGAGSVARPMEDQVVSGWHVEPSELVPGDVVFFQHTYTWGISHVGFYIGDGLFVNAGSEFDAVGISNLNDPYWQSRYLTARRIR
jgi:cell wall-associated NlpC family hydrolase